MSEFATLRRSPFWVDGEPWEVWSFGDTWLFGVTREYRLEGKVETFTGLDAFHQAVGHEERSDHTMRYFEEVEPGCADLDGVLSQLERSPGAVHV